MSGSSVNKVILVGNLGKEPEVRMMQNGKEMVSFSLATSEFWKDKNSGEKQEKTDWHNIVIFSEGLVHTAKSYLHKGSKVYIEGSLKTRKWKDQSDNERYVTEIVLQGFNSSLVLLDRSGSGGNTSSDNSCGGDRNENNSATGGFNDFEVLDDDQIPF